MVRRARGMTLIEVLIALLIATVGLLGGLAMIGSLFASTGFSRHATEAQVLAQQRLEQLQSIPGCMTPGACTPTQLVAYAAQGTIAPADTDLTCPTGATRPTFVIETAGVFGAVAMPIDASGQPPAGTAIKFQRQVAWCTQSDANGARRIITVLVQWNETMNDGSVLSYTSTTTGYHEIIVQGVRLQ